MSTNKEVIEFADTIDFSSVHRSDRPWMREILMGILRFHETMPPLEVAIFPTDSEYNITITGWNQQILFSELYKTFLGDSRSRAEKYNRVLELALNPSPDDDRPYLKFIVSRDGHVITSDKVKK